MEKSPPPQRWFQRRRKDPGHVPEDAADVGTAFGMELSLGGQEPSAEHTPAQAAEPKAGWAQRVMGRQRKR